MSDGEIHVMARVGSGGCAYCKDAIEAEELRTCAGCQATYHADCLERELGGCATLGCTPPLMPTGRTPIQITVSPGGAPRVGSTRACRTCAAPFLVLPAARYDTTCPACMAERNTRNILVTLGLMILFVLALSLACR